MSALRGVVHQFDVSVREYTHGERNFGETASVSETELLRQSIATDRRRVTDGERPRYHAVCRLAPEGVDITIRELPIVHLFAPDDERLQDAALA